MEIQHTNRYGKFSQSDLNREVNETHVRELVASIQQCNLLQFNPIIVNKEMEVIDGQHRLEAAKRLQTEIFYVVSDKASIKETRILNRANKSWSLLDYVRSYAFSGNENCQLLANIIEKYDLPVSVALELLATGIKNRDTSNTKALRNGSVLVGDLPKVYEIGDRMIRLQPFCELGKVKSRVMIRAIKHLDEVAIDFEYLINKLLESGWKLRGGTNYRDLLRQFEDVINFKVKNRTRLY